MVPGFILTPMMETISDKIKQYYKELIPLGRFGQPEGSIIIHIIISNVSLVSASNVKLYELFILHNFLTISDIISLSFARLLSARATSIFVILSYGSFVFIRHMSFKNIRRNLICIQYIIFLNSSIVLVFKIIFSYWTFTTNIVRIIAATFAIYFSNGSIVNLRHSYVDYYWTRISS